MSKAQIEGIACDNLKVEVNNNQNVYIAHRVHQQCMHRKCPLPPAKEIKRERERKTVLREYQGGL